MLTDLRFALRLLRSRPWFSAAVVATLGLGIGINTAVFTLVNAVLFKPVPLPKGDRIVTVSGFDPTQPQQHVRVSWPDFLEYRKETQTFEGLEAAAFAQAVLSEPQRPPERFRMMRVTPGMFSLLQTPPILGRAFGAADGRPGAEKVLLIGHHVWQNRYGGAPDIAGRSIELNGEPATIIGVMPQGFKFPTTEDVWSPLVPDAELEDATNRTLMLFGVLQPGRSAAQANLGLDLVATRLAAEFPETHANVRAKVRTFHDTYNGDQIRVIFLMILGAVGFVLLIACANVANMMLSRAIARAREMSLRTALGASRSRLIRQLLVESVLLSCLGGLLGLGLAAGGVHAFDLATQDVGKPYWVVFEMDYTVFAYFAALSVLTGLLFGLLPALRASRVDLNSSLKDGTPAGGSARGGRLAGTLVVLQFALTMILLAGAGMMVRSFFAAQSQNAFVRPESLFTARLHLPETAGQAYEDAADRTRFIDELLPRLAALPGVTHAAIGTQFPGLGADSRPFEREDRPVVDRDQAPRLDFIVQTPGYFETIGLPLLSGRDFGGADGEPGREVAVVTRAFAEQHWPGQSALGQRFRFLHEAEPGPWMTIIGVSADFVHSPRRAESHPLVFISHRQETWGWNGLLLRTEGNAAALTGLVRAAVQAMDASLPVFETRTLAVALERERWFLSVFGSLFLIFALIGLLIASVGVYAVVATTTSRRTREIGIRMALGATRAGILRLVLSRGMRQLGIGLGLGLGGAVAATHLMDRVGFLVEVSPHDPLVFAGVVMLLASLGFLACWIPASRAAGIQPTRALRSE